MWPYGYCSQYERKNNYTQTEYNKDVIFVQYKRKVPHNNSHNNKNQ